MSIPFKRASIKFYSSNPSVIYQNLILEQILVCLKHKQYLNSKTERVGTYIVVRFISSCYTSLNKRIERV